MAKMKRFMAMLMAMLMILQVMPVEAMAEGIEGLKSRVSNVITGSTFFTLTFTVEGKDGNDDVITQYVENGQKPVLPENPAKAGYTFVGWFTADDNEVTKETLITSDMAAVARFTSIATVTVTVNYVAEDGTTPVADPTIREYLANGADAEVITCPAEVVHNDVTLYPEQTSVTVNADLLNKAVDGAVTVTVKYAQANAQYTVQHWALKPAYASYEVLPEEISAANIETYCTPIGSEEKVGASGATVTPNPLTGDAFDHYDFDHAESVVLDKSDKKTVNVFYIPKTYTLTYNTQGGSYVAPKTGKYNSEVVVYTDTSAGVTTPTKTGYVFEGWYIDKDGAVEANKTMLLTADTTVYAKWTAGTASYTVAYFKEVWNNATNSSEWSFISATSKTGTVGSEVSGSDDISTPANCRYERSETKTVAADGSTVVKVYYKLIRYTLIFNLNDDKAKIHMNGKDYKGSEYKIENVVVGQDVSALWPTPDNTTTTSTQDEGWFGSYPLYLDTWNSSYKTKRFEITADMVSTADDYDNVTYRAYWTTNSTQRQVNYWLQDTEGKYYVKEERYCQKYINTGTLDPKEIFGFTKVSGTPSGRDKDNNRYPSSSNGNKEFYYNRAKYSITYMYKDTKLDTKTGVYYEANINSDVYNYTPSTPAGVDPEYTFAGWYDNAECVGDPYVFSTMPGANLVLYAKFVPPTKQVTLVFKNGNKDQVITLDKGSSLSEVSVPVRDGYTFLGWFETQEGGREFDINQPINDDITLYAHWKMNDLSYTVHYVQVENGVETEFNTRDVTSAAFTDGQKITEKAITVVGWRFDAAEKEIELHVGVKNEITFYYTRMAPVRYMVHHYIDGTVTEVAPDETGTTDAEQIVVKAKGKVVVGNKTYYPTKTSRVMKLTSVEANNVYTFYYLPYQTGTITIEYHLDGKLDDSETKSETLRIGESVKAETYAKSIENYYFDHAEPDAATVDHANDEGTISLYYYSKRAVSLTVGDVEAVYNGQEQTGSQTVNESALKDGHRWSYEGAYTPATGTKVGTTTGSFDTTKVKIVDASGKDVSEQYSISTDPGDLIIRQRLTVTKKVEAGTAVPENGFTFKLTKDGAPVAKASYYIGSASGTIRTTGSDGSFTLKADETAIFTELATGTYTVSETKADGWVERDPVGATITTSGADEVKVTFTNTRATGSLTVQKVWSGDANYSDNRVGVELTIERYVGEAKESGWSRTVQLTAENALVNDADTWQTQIENVETHDADGNEYTYMVTGETAIKSNEADKLSRYDMRSNTAKADGTLTATNTLKVGSVKITKTVANQPAADKTNFTFVVKQGDTTVGTFTLNGVDDNSKEHVIDNLLAGNYTVVETIPENAQHTYATTVTVGESSSETRSATFEVEPGKTTTVKFVNTVSDTTSVTVTKVWDDQNNRDYKRPATITVQLLKGTEVLEEKEISATNVDADNTNRWNYTWSVLPKYEDGVEIVYLVDEKSVPAEYSKTVSGYTITNRYTPGEVSVSVRKVWNDANNFYGKRPESVTVKLYKDGVPTGEPLTLNEDNGWSGTFTGLDKYSGAGKLAVYTVQESTVPNGYTETVAGKMDTGYTITNTLTRDASFTVSKIATDENGDPDNSSTFTFKLMLGDKTVTDAQVKIGDGAAATIGNGGTFTLKNGQTATISNLPDGDYTVTEFFEDENAGNAWTTKVGEVETRVASVKNGENVTFTNARVPRTIEVNKTWVDAGETDRPKASFNLQKKVNGKWETVGTKSTNGASVSFIVPKFDENGTEIVYQVTESPLKDYTVDEQAKTVGENDTVSFTNTRMMQVVVNKEWVTNGIKVKTNPTVMFQLYKGDEAVEGQTKELTDGNSSVTFTDLPYSTEYKVEEVRIQGGEIDTLNGNGAPTPVPAAGYFTLAEKQNVGSLTEQNGVLTGEVTFTNTATHRAVTVTKKVDLNGTEWTANAYPTFNFKLEWKSADNQTHTVTLNLTPAKATNNSAFSEQILVPVGAEVEVTETEKTGWTAKDGNVKTILANEASAEFTNIRKTTTISGTKNWVGTKPENAQIELTVKRGDDVLGTETVRPDAATGAFTIDTVNGKNLAEYDENGAQYTYTIEETQVEGYTTSYGANNTITNTQKSNLVAVKAGEIGDETFSVSVNGQTKELGKDDNKLEVSGVEGEKQYTFSERQKSGYYLEKITVEVDGEKTEETSYAGTPLPTSKTVTADAGKTVTVTFTNMPQKGTFSVTKRDADGVVPGVTFTLFQGEEEIDEVTTGADGVATFEDVAIGEYTLKETGAPSDYMVDDTAYTVRVVGNNRNTPVADVTVKKGDEEIDTVYNAYAEHTLKLTKAVVDGTWNAVESAKETFAFSVTLENEEHKTFTAKIDDTKYTSDKEDGVVTISGITLKNGEPVEITGLPKGTTATITEDVKDTVWTTSWTDAKQLNIGNGKTASVTIGDTDEDVTATNTRVTLDEADAIALVKNWEDNGDALRVRPGNITVKLQAKVDESNFVDTDLSETRSVGDINGTYISFGGKNLAKYDLSGKEYSYKFVETAIGGQPLNADGMALGYQNTATTVNGKTTTITNKIVPTTVTVTKSWNDAWDGKQNYFDLRPTVEKFREEWIELYVSADNGTTWDACDATANVTESEDKSVYNVSYTNLPQYNADGHELTYRVAETVRDAEHYELATEGLTEVAEGVYGAASGGTLTNSLKRGTLTISKTIVDESSDASDVTFTFEVKYGDVTVGNSIIAFVGRDEKTGTATVRNVPYGTYTVTEQDNAGWTLSAINGTAPAEGNRTATVALNGEKATVSFENTRKLFNDNGKYEVEKQWAGVKEGETTPEVTVTLKQNDVVYSASVKLNEGNSWKHTFENLPLTSADGQTTYVYTADEATVPGYTGTKDPTATTTAKTVFINTALTAGKIVVTKNWVDENDKYKLRPTTVDYADWITLQRSTNGQDWADYAATAVTENVEKAANNDNAYIITYSGMPTHDAQGNPYQYRVAETVLDKRYVANLTGGVVVLAADNTGTITNTLTMDGELTITKKVKDASGESYKQTFTFEVKNEKNVTVQETVEVTVTNGEGENTITVSNLPHGKYTVTEVLTEELSNAWKTDKATHEVTVSGAEAEVLFTNTRKLFNNDQGKYTVTKVWQNMISSETAPALKVTLKRSDNKTYVTTLTAKNADADGNWTYTFENLPAYSPDGKTPYRYTAEETVPNGYEQVSRVPTDTFATFTNEPIKTSVTVDKIWEDGSNEFKLRPDAEDFQKKLTLERSIDSEKWTAYTAASVTAVDDKDDTYTVTYSDLPTYDAQGNPYQYRVTESTVDFYKDGVSDLTGDNVKITNTLKRGSLIIEKTIVDATGDGQNPTFVFQLMRKTEGKVPAEKELYNITVNGTTGETTIDNLPAGDYIVTEVLGEMANAWSVKENNLTVSVEEGKTATVSFTNTRKLYGEKGEISGTKTWKMIDGEAYPTITIKLLRNNVEYKTVDLANGETEFKFPDLPLYDQTGKTEYTYSVEEVVPEGYELTQTDTNLTNTAKTLSVTVTKTWLDGDGAALKPELQPATLDVQLKRNGDVYRTATLKKAEDWTIEFTDLPTHDAEGNKYVYTVTETLSKNFTATSEEVAVQPVALDGELVPDAYMAELVNTKETENKQDPEKTVDDSSFTNVIIDGTTNKMVKVGDVMVYTIRYYNHLNTKATIVITDKLNENLEFVDATKGGTCDDQNLVTWEIKDVAPFTEDFVTVTVRVKDSILSDAVKDPQIPNTASVKIGDDPAQEAKADDVTVYNANFSVTKTVEKKTYTLGETARFTITVENTGNVPLENVAVKDEMVGIADKPVSDVKILPGDGYTVDENGDVTIAELGVYDEVVISAEYTVISGDLGGKKLENHVVATAKDPYDPDGKIERTAQVTFTTDAAKSLTILKDWVGTDEDTQPDEIGVQLMVRKNGEESWRSYDLGEGERYATPETMTGSGANWNEELFTNLPAHDENGVEYEYTAVEVSIDGRAVVNGEFNGYDIAVEESADEVRFTNTRQMKTIRVQKNWIDGEGNALDLSLVPNIELAVQLRNTADGTVVDEVKLSKANNWTAEFEAQPVYDKAGNAIAYAVAEVGEDGKVITLDGKTYDVSYAQPETTREGTAATITNARRSDDPEDNKPTKEAQLPENKNAVEVGDTIEYTIKYHNSRNVAATVTITDVLDKGLTFESASRNGSYNAENRTVTWTLSNVVPFEDGSVTLRVTVNEEAKHADETAAVKNQATVVIPGNDAEIRYDTNPVETPVEPEKPTDPTKEATGIDEKSGTVTVGQQIEYTIGYRNHNNAAAAVTVTDKLDKGVKFLFASEGGVYDEATHTVTWKFDKVAPFTTDKVTLKVEVTEAAREPENDETQATVKNSASVAIGNEAAVDTNVVDLPVKPEEPEKPEKKATNLDQTGTKKVGDEIVYTIEYHNHLNTVENITVVDKLDEGVDFVSADNGGAYDAETHTVTWKFDKVAPFKGGTVTLTVAVNENARRITDDETTATVDNAATVEVGNDYTSTSETVKVPVTPDDPTDPTKKADDKALNAFGMVAVGDELPFTVSYVNNLNTVATVTVRDTLEEGLTFVSADNGGTYDEATRTVTWVLKDVAPFTSGSVTVITEVNENAVDAADPTVANSAVVKIGDQPEQTTEPAEVTVYNPDFSVEKKLTNLPAKGYFTAGETAAFDITVKNTGNVPLENVAVEELLDGVTFVQGEGYTIDGRIATIAALPIGEQIVLKAEYTVIEADLGNTDLANRITVRGEVPENPDDPDQPHNPEDKGDEEPIPVDECVEITGTKTWNDADNAYGARPDVILVTLLANGEEKIGTRASAETEWKYTFIQQPKHDADGNEVVYSIREEEVPGYDTTYSAEGYDITNTLRRHTLTIRYWIDEVGGEQAFKTFTRDYYYGERYNVVSPAMDGYRADPEVVSGRIEGDLEVDVVYTAILWRLNIRYRRVGDGKTLAPMYTNGNVIIGDAYEVESPVIPGYTADRLVVKGEMHGRNMSFTVWYTPEQTEVVIVDEKTPFGLGNVVMNAGDCFE